MEELSEAVLHWLEYQHCVGIDSFLNESALTIPIVACLTAEGWVTKKETDYAKLCASIAPDKCYADFYFVRDNERLVLETKLYKQSPQSKLFEDIVRLSLPLDIGLRRIALVAYAKQRSLWGQFDALLNLSKSDTLEIDPVVAKLRLHGNEIGLVYNEKGFAKLRAMTSSPLSAIAVTCVGKSDANRYAVRLFSVARGSD